MITYTQGTLDVIDQLYSIDEMLSFIRVADALENTRQSKKVRQCMPEKHLAWIIK